MKTILFHIHTKKSYDANIKIEKLLDYVIKNKIDYFCVTDHHSFEACEIIEKLLKSKKYRGKTKLVKGMEITTEYGDIIPLFIKKEIKTREFLEVVRETKKQKGLLIIPHPYHMHKHLPYLIKHVDGIEIFNSCGFNFENKKAMQLALENPQLLHIAAVDAHLINELGNALNEIKLGKKIKIKPIFYKSSGRTASLKHFIMKVLNIIKNLFRK